MNCNAKTDIVILGAGIGGYEAFRTLSKLLRRHRIDKKITLVDQNNYFTFIPMLHEVASGSILASHAAVPIRELVENTPHSFMKAKVLSIEPEKNLVRTENGAIEYEYGVVALGSKTNFFSVPGAEEHAYHLRDLGAALRLQKTLIDTLETCGDDELTITIIGGGFTGVEMAGQFCDLASNDFKRLYPEKKIAISIVQSQNDLIPYLPEKARKIVKKRLAKEGVKLLFGSRAVEVTPQSVKLKDGRILHSDLTVWTAGFENIGPCFLEDRFCDRGRISVNDFLQVPKHKNLYAIGDIALKYDKHTGSAIPQLAEVAHREGIFVAKHLVASIQNKTTKPFTWKSHGTLMPIGDWFGVAVIGKFVFSGFFAWWLRRTVYLLYMPGIARKLRVVFDWTLHVFGRRHIINIDTKQ